MSVYDFVDNYKNGKKPYHSHEFADKERQKRIGSTAVSPFQKRQEIEKKRKKIGAYKISRVAYDMDAKRALLKEQKRQKALHKMWLLRQLLYGFPRSVPKVEPRAVPTMQQYRYKPQYRKDKRFSKIYMPKAEGNKKELN